jgi:ParB-like chromosome segregation protein Spo0J
LIKEGLQDLDARILNLSENVQRKDLNIMQEAKALDHFRRAQWDLRTVASKIGMSRGWVEVRYMLLQLPSEIQKEAEAGLLTQEQIRKVHRLGEVGTREDQFDYIRQIKDQKLGMRKTEPKAETKNAKRVRGKEEMFELQDRIREAIGNNLATRAIAYATGEIDDNEMYSALYYEAKVKGVYFALPEGLTLLPEDQI